MKNHNEYLDAARTDVAYALAHLACLQAELVEASKIIVAASDPAAIDDMLKRYHQALHSADLTGAVVLNRIVRARDTADTARRAWEQHRPKSANVADD